MTVLHRATRLAASAAARIKAGANDGCVTNFMRAVAKGRNAGDGTEGPELKRSQWEIYWIFRNASAKLSKGTGSTTVFFAIFWNVSERCLPPLSAVRKLALTGVSP